MKILGKVKPKNHRVKIVATIGPATKTERDIRALIEAGMDIARFNFSHGYYEEYARWVTYIRRQAKKLRKNVEILGDLQGPRFRVGPLPKTGKRLLPRQKILISYGEKKEKCRRNEINITGVEGEEIALKKGDPIMLDNGTIELRLLRASGEDSICEVVTGGIIYSHKGVNLPTITLKDNFTAKDAEDLEFILKHEIDYVGLSFVSNDQDVTAIKERVQGKTKLIAKIERRQAIEDFEDILHTADGIMVARGDLGIEIPLEKVPLVQKRIIRRCRVSGKPVITATQMLASMADQPRPTRAEVSDVANAVLDGTSAVMLSDETAMGKYPIKTVEMMRAIVEEAEYFSEQMNLRSIL
ncbi:MAG TPA: pyruvate kinase [bacterium]|jgi:pyruvate kinase|nr:pyruvate kinase [bacterium]HOR57311.1 pyruvate kinase [bacterium]HPL56154.1 pyruvate kinase [bacterium]HPM27943.1 pyruvate kinase [bacterium]